MQMAANVSVALGWIDAPAAERIAALLTRAGLPVSADGVTADAVLDGMQLDKKTGSKGLRIILLRALGQGTVVTAPERDILHAGIERQLKAGA
jgi:3-dehydroquinate synthetase